MKRFYYLLLPAMMLYLASCGTDPNIESARLALLTEDYSEAIENARAAIEADSTNPEGYHLKGVSIASRAFDGPVEEREPDYNEARELFDQAEALYEDQTITGGDRDDMHEFIFDIWGTEFNTGIDMLTEDIVSSDEDSLRKARYHFTNSKTIQPDSLQPYSLLAEVNYALGDYEQAIEVTESILYDLGMTDDLYSYYRLAAFHQELDNFPKAIEIMEDARERFPEEMEIIQELAFMYFQEGQTDRAIEEVAELIERDPENPEFRIVYGSQMYQIALRVDDEIQEINEQIMDKRQEIQEAAREEGFTEEDLEEMEAEIAELEEKRAEHMEEQERFAQEAEEELLQAKEMAPEDPDVYNTLGIIYQNRGAQMFDLRNLENDPEKINEYDERGREYLREALPYFEEAVELDPDDQESWRSLFEIYVQLGDEEKALEAQERAGLDDMDMQQQPQQEQEP